MIPVTDNLPGRPYPIATYTLVGANVGLFLLELHLEAAGELGNFLQAWGLVPARLHQIAGDAIADGNPAAVVAFVALGLRALFGSLFLHGSFSQILGNMLFLRVFGRSLENALGKCRFLLLYIGGGAIAAAAQAWIGWESNVPFVGANGAIAAVLGAYVFRFPKAQIESVLPLVVLFIPAKLPVVFYLAWWFVQQGFYGIGTLNVSGGINPDGFAYWAHGIGAIAGVALLQLTRTSIRSSS